MERKWAVDFQEASSSSAREIPDPLGYGKASGESDDKLESRQRKEIADADFKRAKAIEFAMSPGKQVAMMAFMMYMAGSQLNIFSIGIVASGLWSPISALQSINKAFEPYKDPRNSLFLPKLLYCAIQFGGLLVCAFKLNSLGLLPTHSSDWVSGLSPRQVLEFSGGGFSFS